MHGRWSGKGPYSSCRDPFCLELMQIFANGLTGQAVPVDTDRFELTEQLKVKLQVFTGLTLHAPSPSTFRYFQPIPSQSSRVSVSGLLAHTCACVCWAQDATGVPAAHLRVCHAGRQLSDGHQLADYNISQNAVLHLTLRLWWDPPRPMTPTVHHADTSIMRCASRPLSLHAVCRSCAFTYAPPCAAAG